MNGSYHGEPPVCALELGVGALPVEPEHGVEVGAGSRRGLLLLEVASAASGGHVGRSARAAQRAEAPFAASSTLAFWEEGGAEWLGVREGTGATHTAGSKQGGARGGARKLAGLRFYATREGSRTGGP